MATIWYISKYASVPPAQAGIRGFRLIKEFQSKGHAARLICSNSNHLSERLGPSKKFPPDSDIRILRAPNYRRGESLVRLLSWIIFDLQVAFLPIKKSEKPNFIIASTPSLLTPLAGHFLAKRTGAALIVEIRDIWPLTGTEEYGYPLHHPLVRVAQVIEKFSFAKCAGVVGLMPGIDRHVSEILGKERPVVSIGLGFDSSLPLSPPRKLRRKKGQPLRVGYAGTIGKSNGMDVFFRAVRELQGDPRFQFEVAGSGDELSRFKQQYGHLANVRFLGRIPRAEAMRFMRDCDLLYFSSPQTLVSQFGQSLNKVVDYMTAGRPILGSYSGYLTMINEADAGWIIPAGEVVELVNALKQIETKPASVLNQKGRNGFDWISSNRSYEKLSTDYLDFISSLVEDSAA